MDFDWLFGDKAKRQFPLLGGFAGLGEALGAMQAKGMTDPMGMFTGQADPLEAVVNAARAGVLGREITFRIGSTEVTLTIVDLDVRSTPMGLMVGQYEDVRLVAERVSWGATRVRRLSIRCRNVHLRTGAGTTLVAAPVEIDAVLDEEELARWLGSRARWAQLSIGADRVARLSLADHPKLGHIEVTPRMDGAAVRLVPTAIVLRGRRYPVRRSPGLRIQPAGMPRGALLRGVETGQGEVSISAVVPEWRQPVSRALLGKLIERLRARRGRVDIPREEDHEPAPDEPLKER